MSSPRLSNTALALTAAIASVLCLGAGESPPPLTVTVTPVGHGDAAVLMPVEFTAPFESASLSADISHYMIGSNGELFACQVAPFGEPDADLGYRWARVRAMAPLVERTYQFLESRNPRRPQVPLVGAIFNPGGAVLDTGLVSLSFDPALFMLARGVDVGPWRAVPEYDEGLLNRQQGLALVVTDRFRHADFPLAPKASQSAFRLAQAGPVEASVIYEGSFGGPGGIEAIPFDATVSLLANHILRIAVRVPAGGFDGEVYELKNLTMTLPLVLERSARVTFGGTREHLDGLRHWRGTSRLAVAQNGSYEFNDVKGPVVSGAGPVTWVHYGDGDGGVACFWREAGGPVEFSVLEYDEDLLSLSVTPERLPDGSYEAGASFLFSVGAVNPSLLGSCALGLHKAAEVTVDPEYVRALTTGR